MQSIGERVRALRKSEGLTLAKFGEMIGISNPSVSNIESGKTSPSKQTVLAICREFGVSEAWLRDGAGEMLVRQSADEQLQRLAGGLMSESSESFRRRFITALLELPPESWPAVERFLQRLLQSSQPDAPADQELPPE